MKKRKIDRISRGVLAGGFAVLALSFIGLAGRSGVWRSPLFWTALLAIGVIAGGILAHIRRERIFLSKLEALAQNCDPEEAMTGQTGEPLRLSDEEIIEQLSSRLEESSTASALKTEAELHALQNQINPHFLYNTLEIIRSRAMVQGSFDVAEMVESLALQFRYCINNSGEMATLQQELDHVHNYLLIQRYRFGDRFQYKEVIHDEDERVMRSKLPVMTLQPIIENALVHGVNPRVEGGCITLRIRASARRLHIAIEDDGVGIPEEELLRVRRALQENTTFAYRREQGKKSLGIAMRNVNQRIRFYFGENYGVDISSTCGVGTSVFVTLPLMCTD